MVDEIYDSLLAGTRAEDLHTRIERLPVDQRELLFCMLCSVRNELWATCINHATEVDRVLLLNGFDIRSASTAETTSD